MILLRFFIILLPFLLFSCTHHSYEECVMEVLSGDKLQTVYDSVVVIPRLGCNACTQEADRYYQRYKDNEKILFIFTNLQNLKLLKIQNGYDIVNRSNVIIDKENKYYLKKMSQSDYPSIIYRQEDGSLCHEYLLESTHMDGV